VEEPGCLGNKESLALCSAAADHGRADVQSNNMGNTSQMEIDVPPHLNVVGIVVT
jgi:hypothetical protein